MMYPLLFFATAITFLTNPIGIGGQSTQCSTVDAYCRIEGDNLQGIVSEVQNLTECLETPNEAAFVSYFGPAGFPFIDSCLYFLSCDTLDPCEDCVTQDLSSACVDFCSVAIEGTLGTNLISVIGDISDESTCKQSCQEDDLCSVYTFHRVNSTSSPETCFLLSAIGSPVKECMDNTCATGLPDCQATSPICKYLDLDEGVIVEGALKIEGEKDVALLRLGECPGPIAVAIGGGGRGAYGGGGGGSGYVAYSDNFPAAEYVRMIAFAGSDSEDSYVKYVDNNSTIVLGEAGDYGATTHGGAGYSGGGGKTYDSPYTCYGNGGFGGRDGQNGFDNADCGGVTNSGFGGAGSDVDVTTIPLRSFNLRPGRGGVVETGGAGGGGGVLVDNSGPSCPEENCGVGYGGGGAYTFGGLPGVVLLDFVPDQ